MGYLAKIANVVRRKLWLTANAKVACSRISNDCKKTFKRKNGRADFMK